MSLNLPVLQWKDYKSEAEVIWCPGCGDFAVLSALYHALAQLQIPRHQIAIVSGIGCSSRLPGYVATYGFNAIHGRPLPIAEGVKIAKPELTVLAVGGDGDGLAIGAGHFPHAARRNINITYIMMDNGIYGLTKGQTSPTTPYELKTKSSYYGNPEQPVNPAVLAIAYNASLVCRGTASNPKFLREIFKKGIQHPGFAFIHVLSPCVTYRGGELFDYYRGNTQLVSESHDPQDRFSAYQLAEQESPIMVGELYRNVRPTLEQRLEIACTQAHSGPQNFDRVLDSFRV
jgi:2-oxoglutarate/2-oxoacid ferredoxin oxidoreductase subunit beta